MRLPAFDRLFEQIEARTHHHTYFAPPSSAPSTPTGAATGVEYEGEDDESHFDDLQFPYCVQQFVPPLHDVRYKPASGDTQYLLVDSSFARVRRYVTTYTKLRDDVSVESFSAAYGSRYIDEQAPPLSQTHAATGRGTPAAPPLDGRPPCFWIVGACHVLFIDRRTV